MTGNIFLLTLTFYKVLAAAATPQHFEGAVLSSSVLAAQTHLCERMYRKFSTESLYEGLVRLDVLLP